MASSSSTSSSSSSATGNIVREQQAYATTHHLAKLFEDLTTALIYARPGDPAAFLATEVVRMQAEGEGYRAKPLTGVVDTEESAAAYWEDERVRALLEVRARASAQQRLGPAGVLTYDVTHTHTTLPLQELFALLLHSKPADPYAFLRDESLKLQALRASSTPVVRGTLCAALRAASPSSHPLPCPPLAPTHSLWQSSMFTDSDLQGMFSLFDPVSNNYITADQARTALRNLGIKDLSSVPEAGGTRIDSAAFLQLARAALDRERTL